MIKPREIQHELVGTFTDRRNAQEWRRLLSIGCVHNALGSTEGRVVEENGVFKVFATKGHEATMIVSWNNKDGELAAQHMGHDYMMPYDYEMEADRMVIKVADVPPKLVETWMGLYCRKDDWNLLTL